VAKEIADYVTHINLKIKNSCFFAEITTKEIK